MGLFLLTATLLKQHIKLINKCTCKQINMSRDSSVGTATRYGLDGPEIESRWHFNDFTPGSLPGVKQRGVALITYPHLLPRLKKEQSYTSTPNLGLRGLFYGGPILLLLHFTNK